MMTRIVVIGLAALGVSLAVYRQSAGRAAAASAPEVPAAASTVTYTGEIGALMERRCMGCHREGGVAPLALGGYERVLAHAQTIRRVVAERRMPPWHADRRYGRFSNDRSMTGEEIRQLTAWIDAGMPRGTGAEPKGTAPAAGAWTIGKPDVVIAMPQEYAVPAEGVIDYQRFVVDPGFQSDVWVRQAEARPGSRTVHHILVYALERGRSLYDLAGNTPVVCGFAPGDMPLVLPEGHAKRIPAGARLMFEVHYTPNGKAERDRSSIGLVLAKQAPANEVRTNILGKEDFRIRAGAAEHREERGFTFPRDIRVLTLMPHMHLRGKRFEYRVEHPDGQTEILLSVPRYDFKWQSVYRFAEPPLVPKGARLVCTATWDNSAANPANPDPTKSVGFGLQTWDEMMNGWMDYTEAGPALPR